MYKLLIVDDEDRIRNGIKAIIENAKPNTFKILDAQDGKEGMEIIGIEKPQIVITDIRMPDMDGLEMLQNIRETNGTQPVFLILSGYDNFEYAKKAIKYGVKEYLLKPVRREELIETLERTAHFIDEESRKHNKEIDKNIENNQSRSILRDNYLKLLIEKQNIKEQEIYEQLVRVNVCFTRQSYRVILVEYKHLNKEYKDGFDDLDQFAIRNIVEELIDNNFENQQVFFDSAKRLVILINDDNTGQMDERIRKTHRKIRESLKKYLNIEIFSGVGDIVTGVNNIGHSYNNAVRATKQKVFEINDAVYFFGSAKPFHNSENINVNNSVLFERIAGEVELCNKSNIISLLDTYFDSTDFRNKDISVLEDFYTKLYTYVYHYFVNKSQEFYTFFEGKDNAFLNFDQFWSINQINIYLKRYLIKIGEFITVLRNGSPSRKIIERIIDYVNENYYKDINLNTISDHFEKNNSYLSVLFKKETGKNFIDFLIHIRIQKAKNLLEQTDLKISDIARSVGYGNEKYFFMAFKKVVGKSPQQYRDSAI